MGKGKKMSTTTTQNQPIVITLSTHDNCSKEKRLEKLFPKKYRLICGILQLICAGLVAALQIALLARFYLTCRNTSSYYNACEWFDFTHIGTGILCGFVFGIAGLFGVISVYWPSNCKLITFMITSIIASVFVVPLIFIDAWGITLAYYNHYNDGFYDPTELCLCIFQSLIGLAQAAIAITTAAFSCR